MTMTATMNGETLTSWDGETNMQVFIVWEAYSMYDAPEIVGIYTTRELAEATVRKCGTDDYSQYSAWIQPKGLDDSDED